MSANDPFEGRRIAAKKNAEKADAEEGLYIATLASSPAGRWMLRSLIVKSNALSRGVTKGNSWDMYAAGARDLVMTEIVEKITKHLGYAALDKILEEKK